MASWLLDRCRGLARLLTGAALFTVSTASLLIVGASMHIPNAATMGANHAMPQGSASHQMANAVHITSSCSTVCTLARPTRLERIKKVIKRFGRKLLPDTPPVNLFRFLSTRLYPNIRSFARPAKKPPAYRLYSCYIS